MLAHDIADKPFIKLIEKWLEADIMTKENIIIKPYKGTPQGGLCEALHNPPYAKKVLMQS